MMEDVLWKDVQRASGALSFSLSALSSIADSQPIEHFNF